MQQKAQKYSLDVGEQNAWCTGKCLRRTITAHIPTFLQQSSEL